MPVHNLFKEHHLRVYRYFLRQSGTETVAEDMTQEVFLRALRITSGGGQAGDRAWLFRIARNLWIDRWRQMKRRPEKTELPESAAVHPRQEAQMRLDDALHQLADEDREVFLLKEVGGLSYDEIAAACRTSHASVRSRLFRARQSLRTYLAEPQAQQRQAQQRQAQQHMGES